MRLRLFTLLSVSVMFLVSFAPAVFAQQVEQPNGRDDQSERDDRDGRDGDDVSCLQVQNAFGGQGQYGDADALQYGDSGQGGETVAEVAQELGISQEQVLNCIGVEVQSSDEDRGDADDLEDIVPGTAAEGDLPNTGGPPLPATAFALAMVIASVALLGTRVRRGP